MGAWGFATGSTFSYNRVYPAVAFTPPPWYITAFVHPGCCEYDPQTKQIYWGDGQEVQNPKKLYRQSSGGGAATTLFDAATLSGWPTLAWDSQHHQFSYVYWWKDYSYLAETTLGVAIYSQIGQPAFSAYVAFTVRLGETTVAVHPFRLANRYAAALCDDGVVFLCGRIEGTTSYAIYRDGAQWRTSASLGLPANTGFSFYPVEKKSDRIMSICALGGFGGPPYKVVDSTLGTFDHTYLPAGSERTAFEYSASASSGVTSCPKWSHQRNKMVGNAFPVPGVGLTLAEFDVREDRWRASWSSQAVKSPPSSNAPSMHHPVAIDF